MLSRLMGFLYGDGWAYYNEQGEYYEVGFQQAIKNYSIYKYYKELITKLATTTYVRERVRKGKMELTVYDYSMYSLLKSLKDNPVKYFRTLSDAE